MKNLILYFLWCSFLPVLALGWQAYEKEKLYDSGKVREFTGAALQSLTFPIGGLGTGNITLGGRGEFREIEIFNRPNKGSSPDLTFFSIRVEEEGKESRARILERRFLPPYVGWMGFPRNQLAGIPRFKEAVFRGEYPFAFLRLLDKEVPVEVELLAYNPFIPLSPEKSGIPAAIFNWKVKNNTASKVKISLAFTMLNPIKTLDDKGQLGFGKNLNQYLEEGQMKGIRMTSERAKPGDLEFGSLALVTTEDKVDVQTRWYRGGWWDNAHIFWDDFSDDGRLAAVKDSLESENGRTDVATLLVPFELFPGEEKIVPFYLTWFFPNRENYWNREEAVRGKKFRNHYAFRFDHAWDVTRYLVKNISDLYGETKTFHDLIFKSTYPSYVVDAISSQASSLKTNLVMLTEDGKLFGFEGLSDNSGCCPMNCTHVWNYEQTLAYLFPSLERTVRETDFLHNTFDNGYQVFRTLVPLGDYWWTFKPCADGQMGNIVRVYREWKLSGDSDWLRRLWPRVKAALEFAWKGVGEAARELEWQKERLALPWDPDKDGVMEGEQHNTYDIEFYGPNTMTGSLYLAALKASAEMAEALGEAAKAEEYRSLFSSGSRKYDELLWNGEYYIQKVQVLDGLTVPEHLRTPQKEEQTRALPKYQYGAGCLSDQLLGQYLAHVAGLGYILDKEHVDRAMKSIFAYNFRQDLSDFANVQRVYALNEEAGLLLCSWPRGNRPLLPFVYSDEVWTGIEYQVAASLIYSGFIEEGLAIVKAVRDRHSGFDRNPWNEFECGHHYARALASWAVMLALSGFEYDGIQNFMGFSPRINRDHFSTFWSTGSGWGSFEVRGDQMSLKVEYGSLKLSQLALSRDYPFRAVKHLKAGAEEKKGRLSRTKDRIVVDLGERVELKRGEEIAAVFEIMHKLEAER